MDFFFLLSRVKSKQRSQLRRNNNIKQPCLAQSQICIISLHFPRLTNV
jgi:hypothetical protein